MIFKESGIAFNVVQDSNIQNKNCISLFPKLVVRGVAYEGVQAIIWYVSDEILKKELIVENFYSSIYSLIEIINGGFAYNVTIPILRERVINASPNPSVLQKSRVAIYLYVDYFNTFIQKFGYLIYERPTIVDLMLASHISILDYLTEINWGKLFYIKYWYSLIKSRPHFRSSITESVPGFVPPTWYLEPDF